MRRKNEAGELLLPPSEYDEIKSLYSKEDVEESVEESQTIQGRIWS